MAAGQKIPYTEEQKMAAKAEAHPFPEMGMEKATVTGIEEVEGQEAYVVQINEKTKNFYSTETGLKIKTLQTVEQRGQSMAIPTVYSDYRAVNGVKFPYHLSQAMGPVTLEFKVQEIKVNSEVSDSDFQ